MARRWIVSTAWLCSFVSDVDQTWHAYSVVDMTILRWMMGMKRIEKIKTEEIRATACVANIVRRSERY